MKEMDFDVSANANAITTCERVEPSHLFKLHSGSDKS